MHRNRVSIRPNERTLCIIILQYTEYYMLQLTCRNQICRQLFLKCDSWPAEPEERETAETDVVGGSAPVETHISLTI